MKKYMMPFLYSLLWPGLGHIWIGKTRTGVVLCIALLALLFPHPYQITDFDAVTLVSLWLAVAVTYICIIFHCLLLVRKDGIYKPLVRKWYFNILLIVAVFALSTLLDTRYETFHIPSNSMAPVIMENDYIYTEPIQKLERGDIVVFKYPNDTRISYVKRLVGLPGDNLRIINGFVWINGKLTTDQKNYDRFQRDIKEKDIFYYQEKLGRRSVDIKRISANILPMDLEITVPEGKSFVMGDSRDASADSRSWGFVPLDNIYAKPKFIYLSSEGISRSQERFGNILNKTIKDL